jgi:hypothetical protein
MNRENFLASEWGQTNPEPPFLEFVCLHEPKRLPLRSS